MICIYFQNTLTMCYNDIGDKMKFTELKLDEKIIRAAHELGYDEMLPIQEQVIPCLLERKDILVRSKTGSGKTASYVIPEIEKIDWMLSSPQVLVLTPTRELSRQVQNEFKALGIYKRINALAIHGQQPIKGQIEALRQKVHVVSGTIGRILDHIERGTLDVSQIHTCILDEADECFKLGFLDDLKKILYALPSCQKALFSATLNEEVKEVAKEFLNHPTELSLKETKKYNTNVELQYVNVEKENKLETLFHLVNEEVREQAIIFCSFKNNANHVFDAFYEKGYSCCLIHGDLSQEERNENMQDFKRGMFRFLIASDVAARGIDVEKVTHVFNFDVPTTADMMIHRIGRSGRVERKGKAITLVLDSQMKYIERIEEELDVKMQKIFAHETEMPEDLKQGIAVELKDEKLKQSVTKLYIKGGRNKKLRAKDIVGAILQNPMIHYEDIGVIEILDSQSFVEILNFKGEIVLNDLKHRTIKNKKMTVEKSISAD